MKLCFIATNAFPLFVPSSDVRFGGTEVQIRELARFLAGRPGTDVAVVVGDFGQPSVVDAGGVTLLKAVRPNTSGRFLRRIANLVRQLAAAARARADVYITSAAGPETGIAAFYCRLAGKRFVYRTAHQIDCDGSYESGNGWRGRLFGYGLRHADAVVTQTDEHREMLRARGVEATVIRNVFDTARDRRPFDRPIDLLWVGRCERWKNPEMFLDLAEEAGSLRCRMICPPKEEDPALFERVESRARALANLEFVEKVPFSEVQRHFDEAKLFVGTSEYEGFPNTYLQACLGGTPIASWKVDPDGFIARRGAGFRADGDFGALRDWAIATAADPEAWNRCSASAAEYVRSCHDIASEGAKWAKMLDRLAGASGGER